MTTSTPPILRYFSFDHLPAGAPKAVSAVCSGIAHGFVKHLPAGPELSAGLRHLLEAKDCFVRAALDASADAQPAIEAAAVAIEPAPVEREPAPTFDEDDWLKGKTCNPDEPDECESCQ